MAAVFLPALAHRLEHGVVVGNRAAGTDHRASCPVGAEGPRRDGRDLDAKAADFLGQRFADAFERELAAVVISDAGQAHVAGHRRDIDDVATAPLAHGWQHGLDHGHRAEHVDLELAHQLGQRRLLQDALVAVARVVDEHVDRAPVLFDPAHGGLDVIQPADIQDDGLGARAMQGLERGAIILAPHGADHAVPGFQRRLGKGAAQAAADAGDEKGLLDGLHCRLHGLQVGAGAAQGGLSAVLRTGG